MATYELAPDRWHIVTPFKVSSFGQFIRAAKAAGFFDLFNRNQEGYAYCVDPRRDRAERPSLEALYKLLQAHLPPREYALLRIDHAGGGELGKDGVVEYTGDHLRYEKVYRDRIEPTVYSDDERR